MKKVHFLLVLVLFPLFLSGSAPKFGVKGGLYFSTLQSDIVLEANELTITALHERYTGYHLGFVSSFVFPGFFIQPELLWVGTGRDMVLKPNGQQLSAEYYRQEFQHLSMPVLLGMKVGPVKLGIGPVLSVYMSQKNDATLQSDLFHRMNSAVLGYQISAGLQFSSLLFELRHESNLSKYGEGISVGGIPLDFDMRPRQLILSIGLLF